jgi:hypothetical protein
MDVRSDLYDCASTKNSEKENAEIKNCIDKFQVESKNLESKIEKCRNIPRVKDLDNCLRPTYEHERNMGINFDSCIRIAISADKDAKTLLLNCIQQYQVNMTRNVNNYANCILCPQKNLNGQIEMCDLRFRKIYGDNIFEFQKAVENFFGNS